MSYYDNANMTIVDLVADGSHRILEIGCGGGATARAIRARNPDVYYVGVDIAQEPLHRAKDVLDVALCRNIDAVADWNLDSEISAAIPIASFDYVICGDVLEHLFAPEAVVAQICGRLRSGGSLITCIPNVQHWSVFVQLVKGSWPRADSGIFDRTHVRWFARSDMEHLLVEAGLEIEQCVSRIFSEAEGREVIEFLEPLALQFGVDADELMARALPFQYVFSARKA